MNITKSLPLASVLLATTSAAPLAFAQDVFQTGQTARNYNYFQAVYLLDQDEIDLPLLFNVQISITPSFTLSAEYLNLSVQQEGLAEDGNTYVVKSEVAAANAGIGYHRASDRWSRIDWLADILFQQAQLTNSATNIANGESAFFEKSTTDSVVLQLGVRASITPSLEAQAVAATFYTNKEFANEALNLTAVYRVTTHFDVAAGARDAADDPTYNIGLRYSW